MEIYCQFSLERNLLAVSIFGLVSLGRSVRSSLLPPVSLSELLNLQLIWRPGVSEHIWTSWKHCENLGPGRNEVPCIWPERKDFTLFMTRSHDGSLILTNTQPQENLRQVSVGTSIEAIMLHKNNSKPTQNHPLQDPKALSHPWSQCLYNHWSPLEPIFVLTEENTGAEQSRVAYTASVLSWIRTWPTWSQLKDAPVPSRNLDWIITRSLFQPKFSYYGIIFLWLSRIFPTDSWNLCLKGN